MKIKELALIERKIVIGMIINTKYLKQAINLINTKWVQSKEARILITWILEYYNKYKKAPKHDIQDIYLNKLKNNKITKKQAEVIEFILSSLSDENEEQSVNLEYLIDQTEIYCKACQLNAYADQVKEEVELGNVLEAEHMLVNFKPVENIKSKAVIPLGTLKQQKEAFESFGKPIIKYPGALGRMINQYMVPESFVVFLAQNKGGKSFLLMDAAIRAAKQGKNVTLFQAGDMSQAQQERRQAIYLAKKSDLEKYCGVLYIPIMDCVWNQNGSCEEEEREGGPGMEGPFEKMDNKKIRYDLKFHELLEAFEEYPDHIPCYNCQRGNKKYGKFKGTIWYKKRKKVEPLHWKEIHKLLEKRYKNIIKKIRLITYPSEGLTMSKVNAEIDILEKTGFFSEVIILDYMDLMAPDHDTIHDTLRNQENKKWQRARALSQNKRCLLLSASQSDADGMDKENGVLTKKNFSEDRRKLDHITAMIGLNMTKEEKKKGIMRINDIAARDTEGVDIVRVMHRLQIGRPILGSFY